MIVHCPNQEIREATKRIRETTKAFITETMGDEAYNALVAAFKQGVLFHTTKTVIKNPNLNIDHIWCTLAAVEIEQFDRALHGLVMTAAYYLDKELRATLN